jgi:regulator of sigma E protease
MPAQKAGIKLGDELLTANGQEIPAVQALIQLLKRTKDQPLEIVVLRDGQKKTFTVKPMLDRGGNGQEPAYRIGVASLPTKVVKLNFTDALNRSLSDNKKSSLLILELLQKMVRHKVSMRAVDGPIGIGSAVGAAAREKATRRCSRSPPPSA